MELEQNESPSKAYFTHANNITVGHARVIWAPACHPVGGKPLPDGWALPGGERTIDRGRAVQVAVAMDSMSKR